MTDPSASSSSTPRERLMYVPLDELVPGPNAPKTLQAPLELVESLKTYGVLQPLLARPGTDGYEVIAGFKRLAAAQEAGLTEVPIRVYRAEDASLRGLLAATNQFTKGRTTVAPSSDSSGGTPFGGFLDEELNKPAHEAPYRFIILAATVVLLLIWGGVHITKGILNRSGDQEDPVPTPTPGSGSVLFQDPTPTPPRDSSAVDRASALLSEVEGIEVRNAAGFPRIVFQDAVFSRMSTISPEQKPRLQQVVRLIHEADPRAKISIIGHTDNDPVRPNATYRDNEHLGQLRADAIQAFLTESDTIREDLLMTNSSGSDQPPYPNNSATSKAKNRTVSLEIVFRTP